MSEENKLSHATTADSCSEIADDNHEASSPRSSTIADQETTTRENEDQLHKAIQKKEIPTNNQDFVDDKRPVPVEENLVAGSHILSNRILDEVLNEKKIALLQSPDVVQFLQEKQAKKIKTTK